MIIKRYVLITPARNEEAYIESTILSVVSQTILPKKWVIVSDGSNDHTDEIVCKYADKYKFLQLIRLERKNNRNFSSKVNAINMGYKQLKNIEYDSIGNLDADVFFDKNYYENILQKLEQNQKLGIAGGIILEKIKGKYFPQKISLNSVAGAVQLFRRKCYEEIGGYLPITIGGIDAFAEIMARKMGWEVQTFPEIKVFHSRRVGKGKENILKAIFHQGIEFYALGYHPLFQLVRCIYRIKDKPIIVGSMLILCGYFYAFISKYKREVPDDVISFLRKEQLKRIWNILRIGKQNKSGIKINT